MTTCSLPQRKKHPLVLPVFLFLLAFFLRTNGLSNDLHLDHVYHPDSPKLVQATAHFLDDRFGRHYYTHWRDQYRDGYPYLNSHIVEHLYRIYSAARNAVLWHFGVEERNYQPDLVSIFWTTRLLNSFLSSMAVVLAYLVGRRHFGTSTGVVAALLLAFSPVDVMASNYAMSDSTSAFFVLLAAYFAFRIADSPRPLFYVCGGLAAALAFSAKYHGGIALLPLGLAHLFAFPGFSSWGRAAFWSRGLLCIACFILGVLVGTPSLLVYTSGAYRDMLAFMSFSATWGMTEEMLSAPIWVRFSQAMSLNLPQLAGYVGIIPLTAFIAGMLLRFRDAMYWIAVSLPLFFILVGLTTKPLVLPANMLIIIPLMFISAAAALSCLLQVKTYIRTSRFLFTVFCIISIGYLANYSWNEIFFFRHNDTRRIAETWAMDNIPAECGLSAGYYTFPAHHWRESGNNDCLFHVLSARREGNPSGASLIHEVSFEQDKLTQFRNWDIRILGMPNRWISTGFSMPVSQRLPSSNRHDMLQADAPALLRSPRVLELKHEEGFSGTVLSSEPLPEAAFILRNSTYPAEVTISFGGATRTLRLDPHQTQTVFFDKPRRIILSRNKNSLYAARIRSHFNLQPVTVVFAATSLEIARELYLSGEIEQSFNYFQQVPLEEMNISERIVMSIAGLATGRIQPSEVGEIVDAPFLPRTLSQPSPSGHESLPEGSSTVLDDAWFFHHFGVHPEAVASLSPGDSPVDVMRTLKAQIHLLHMILAPEPDADGLDASAWVVFHLRGNTLVREGRYQEALSFYEVANQLDGKKIAVFEALEHLEKLLPEQSRQISTLLKPFRLAHERPTFPVNARFSNNIGISGYQMNSYDLGTHQRVEVALLWDVRALKASLYALEYHVALINKATGEHVFRQRRHFVRSALGSRNLENHHIPPSIVIDLEKNHAPGTYGLFVELRIPMQNRTLRVKRHKPPHERKRMFITEVRIEHHE